MSSPKCLRCHEFVAIPLGVSHRARVQCPLCNEQFELAELFDTLPPMLIVLNDPLAGPTPDTLGLIEPDEADAESFAFLPPAAFRSAASADAPPDLDESSPGLEVAPPLVPEEGNEPAELLSRSEYIPTGTPYRAPRRRKGPGPLATLIQVLGGGVLAGPLALLALWWIFDKDVAELGPRVSRFAPWVVPAQFHAPGPNQPNELSHRADSPAPVADVQWPRENHPSAPTTTSDGGAVAASYVDEEQHGKDANPQQDVDFDRDAGNSAELNGPDRDLTDPPPDQALPADQASQDQANQDQANHDQASQVFRAGAVMLSDAPAYSASELKTTLAEVDQAHQQFTERITREAAVSLRDSMAQLGERLALLRQNEPDGDDEVLAAANAVLERLAGEQVILDFFLTRSAAEQLKTTNRTTPGILFAGVVETVEPAGDRLVARMQLQSQVVTVLMPAIAGLPQVGSTLLVPGHIVEQPGRSIQGFAGSESPVIWAGQPIVLVNTNRPGK